jgi:hypothetical protein
MKGDSSMIARSMCGSGGCITCPFSQNEEAFYADNTGCLPDAQEILELPEKHKVNWGCHGEIGVVCGGLAKESKRIGKEFNKDLPIVDFDEYTYLGMEVAIALAKVRKGINPLEDQLSYL